MFNSFFDDVSLFPSENYQLCKKLRKPDDIDLSKKSLMEGELNLRPSPVILTTKFFKIVDRKLVYFSEQNKNKPKGYYDLLSFMKITSDEYFDHENKINIYSFRLEKFGKFHEFFLKDKKIIKRWIKILRLYCVSSNFDTSYQIEETLGSGHFAKVYKVIDLESNYVFAAKIMEKNAAFFEQKQYIYNEIYILKFLPKNENIIKLFELYESPTDIILIFEYLSGGDLYRKIKDRKSCNEVYLCSIFCQILKGLKFLHSHGVLHRDIKPDNILLSDDSIPNPIAKIADFSLADFYKDKKMKIRCGTPGYMAPEVLNDEVYNEKIDIFSLGIVLFMMLSGKAPFNGKNAEEVIKKNRNCLIKFKKSNWQSISKEGRKLVVKMTSKLIDQRISLQNIFIQKWIRYNYKKSKEDNNIKSKSLSPNHKISIYEKQSFEENKNEPTNTLKAKKIKKQSIFKDLMNINSVNSLFIQTHVSISNNSNSSNIFTYSMNSNQSSAAEILNRNISGSIRSSSQSIYTEKDEESNNDYVLIKSDKSQSTIAKHKYGKKLSNSTMNSTKRVENIFSDENPVCSLMSQLKKFNTVTKPSKF